MTKRKNRKLNNLMKGFLTSKNKAKRALEEFIDSIPEEKLQGPFGCDIHRIYSSKDFRLDMQGVTGSKKWNLQIQANFGATPPINEWAPRSVCTVLVSLDAEVVPSVLRAEFLKSSKFHMKPDGGDEDARTISTQSTHTGYTAVGKAEDWSSFRSSKASVKSAGGKARRAMRNRMREFKNIFKGDMEVGGNGRG